MAPTPENLYRHFVPSRSTAVAFTVIFGILTLAHTGFIVYRKRYFPIIIVIGGIFEFAGHGARIYSSNHLREIPAFATQMILVLLAPILFAAGIYMFLGRIIRATGHADLSPIRTSWITKIFVLGDVFCFFVQLVGAGRLVNPKKPSDAKAGQNIILGGLILQILIFVFFVAIGVMFHRRYRKKADVTRSNLLELHLYSLYFCSILILIRSIFRVVEYKSGQNGYLMSHEWPVYTFDVGLMALVMIVGLNWYRGSLDPMENMVVTEESYQLRG